MPTATSNSRFAGKVAAVRLAGGRGVFLESLLLAAVALLVLNLHPFGSAQLRRHFSQDLIYAWFGDAHWLYPRAPAGSAPGPAKQPRAVVVLVDEAALELRGAHWPVPLPFHAQMLAEIEVLRPRAVMLDFLLIDHAPPDDVCALLTTAAKLRGEGIPVYLAVTRYDDMAAFETPDCVSDAGSLLHADQVFTAVSVRRQFDAADFVTRRYPFEERGELDAPGSGLSSAAVRMYCDSTPRPDRCAASLTREGSRDAGFELAWSPQGDPFNQRWSQTACSQGASPLRAILGQTLLPRQIGCPPIATLFASALLSPAQDPAFGANNERLFDLVEGSFVFLGGNFRASGDLITTPMHTLLPGVYYHAVALENLILFDGKPKIREEFRRFRLGIYAYDLLVLWALAAIFLWRQQWVGGGDLERGPFSLSRSALDWAAALIARTPVVLSIGILVAASLLLSAYPLLQLAAIIAAILALALIEIRVASHLELKVRIRNIILYFAALGLSLTVVALTIWFGYRWLSLPPGDWVGYLSFSAVGFFLAHTAIVEFARRVGSIRGAYSSRGGVG